MNYRAMPPLLTKNTDVSCFERIWESDSLLNSHSLSSLNNGLSRLRESQPLEHNEDNVTATLIDPFLHCLVYGRTQVYDTHHPEALRPQPAPSHLGNYFVSQKFAFIPTDFSVSNTGHVRFMSYINNLNPGETSLYRSIENLLRDCVPLFNHVLTDLHRNNPHPRRIQGHCRYIEWDEPEPPEHSDDEDGWSAYERDVRHWVMHRPIEIPDVPINGYPGGLESRKYAVDLHGRILQVVVHVSEIRLEPNNPVYTGSPWHVEGMKNERIAACAFYYSSVENITENYIEFRMAVTSPKRFHAGDTGATMRTWAMNDGDPCHQYIGSKPTSTGLAIAFPNIYQYRHPPFRLHNSSKEGHQRLVAFYLVDPEIQPVVSTSRVPPQQKSWIKAAVEESIDARLPVELVEKIVNHVEGKMSRDEAVDFRREMLEERVCFWAQNDNYHFCIPFDIWNELY